MLLGSCTGPGSISDRVPENLARQAIVGEYRNIRFYSALAADLPVKALVYDTHAARAAVRRPMSCFVIISSQDQSRPIWRGSPVHSA